MADTVISTERRRVLDSILDLLVPCNRERGIPGAGEAGVVDYLTRVAARNPVFNTALGRLLAQVPGPAEGMNAASIRRLEHTLPREFALLLTETYKGYYSRPDLRAKFGVGAHAVHPSGYEVARESAGFMDGLTEPVRTRGPFYRDPTRIDGD